jgi:hypothetical protein
MNYSTVKFVDLSDEILLIILTKLNNIDVLYSLIGVNQKFDRLAQDIIFTQSLDFTSISSNEDDQSIINRFCLHIVPRIQHNIQCLTLDPWSMDSVLCIEDYPKLYKLTLVNLKFKMTSLIFNGMLFDLIIYK